jgi:hypothetical protein
MMSDRYITGIEPAEYADGDLSEEAPERPPYIVPCLIHGPPILAPARNMRPGRRLEAAGILDRRSLVLFAAPAAGAKELL